MTALAGLVTGLLVLGVGGRVLMRVIAYTGTEGPRFSWLGTLEVLGAGAAWGTMTAPLLLLFRRSRPWAAGLKLGLLLLGLTILVVGSVLGFGGRVVAPPAFIVLTVVLFPLLFLTHGITVALLASRWQRRTGRFQREAEPRL